MIKSFSYFFFSIYLLFFMTQVDAAVPEWKIIPDESSLYFSGIQNKAPVTGQFKRFSGTIFFDPENLKESQVTIVVDMSSLTTPLKDVEEVLKVSDWFNSEFFPTATFKSKEFTKIDQKTYEVKGMLTLRDITLPVILHFTLEESTPSKALVKGEGTLKRLAWGVGRGEWGDTSIIEDSVSIKFTLSAEKK